MKKLETRSAMLSKHHLEALKQPTILAECENVALRAAKENVDHLGLLLQLCELELLDRERRAAVRRLKRVVGGSEWPEPPDHTRTRGKRLAGARRAVTFAPQRLGSHAQTCLSGPFQK